MNEEQLQQSFRYCVSHCDPDAWVALAMAYLQRNYVLNADYCMRQAETAAQSGDPNKYEDERYAEFLA